MKVCSGRIFVKCIFPTSVGSDPLFGALGAIFINFGPDDPGPPQFSRRQLK